MHLLGGNLEHLVFYDGIIGTTTTLHGYPTVKLVFCVPLVWCSWPRPSLRRLHQFLHMLLPGDNKPKNNSYTAGHSLYDQSSLYDEIIHHR